MNEDELIKEYEIVIQFYQVSEMDRPGWYMLDMTEKYKKIIGYRKYLETRRESDSKLLEYILNRPILLSDEEKRKLYKLSIEDRERIFKVETAYKRRELLAQQSQALQNFFKKEEPKKEVSTVPQEIIPRDYMGWTVNFSSERFS
jgi:hypothetical protein